MNRIAVACATKRCRSWFLSKNSNINSNNNDNHHQQNNDNFGPPPFDSRWRKNQKQNPTSQNIKQTITIPSNSEYKPSNRNEKKELSKLYRHNIIEENHSQQYFVIFMKILKDLFDWWKFMVIKSNFPLIKKEIKLGESGGRLFRKGWRHLELKSKYRSVNKTRQ